MACIFQYGLVLKDYRGRDMVLFISVRSF